jgi:hypothetical protein
MLFRLKKLRLDKEYYIFRELVMSERTYKKDIELINTVSILFNNYLS